MAILYIPRPQISKPVRPQKMVQTEFFQMNRSVLSEADLPRASSIQKLTGPVHNIQTPSLPFSTGFDINVHLLFPLSKRYV